MTVEENSPMVAAQGIEPVPYGGPHEHLADLLVRHDWLLKRELAGGRVRKPADAIGMVAIAEEEVQRLLDVPPMRNASAADLQAIDRWLQRLQLQIDSRVEKSLEQGVRLPIIELAQRFGLTAREMDLLLACAAVELDRRYERIYGFLHDDMSRRLASPGLAISLYCDSTADRLTTRALLNAQAPLRYYRLLEIMEDGAATPWLSRSMRIDDRIVAFVLGDRAIDSRVARYVTPQDALADSIQVDLLDGGVSGHATRDELSRQLLHWTNATHERKRPLIYLHGERHAGADGVVRGVAQQLGVAVLTLDAELLLEPGADVEQVFFLSFREGLLSQAAIYLRNIDRVLEGPEGAARYRVLRRCIAEMGSIVFASGEAAWCWQLPAEPVVLRILELRLAGFIEQLQVWQALSNGAIAEYELHRLISLHPLPIAAIGDAWRMARVLAAATDESDALPTFDQVQQACRTQAGAPVSSLARRLVPKHQWCDLVLPSAQLEQLSAICSQAKHSSIVYGAWRFDHKMSLGKGLNALFSGPPGTGKTMAAEVIAADLGVEILKIDLSQIVSKYIGETEKNLRQLFDQAARANAILFFDEADALLGKRSDVKDAHDRYANTEIAYLLQKMEEYAGITILATNLRQNMDEAFTRRMRFIVEFPFPEDEDRLRIWQAVWPGEVPLAPDVDLQCLAKQFRVSGGSIRNIALSAAFLAAEQKQPVSMRHLMRATKRELQKMGRLVNDEEYRRYG